MTRLCESPKTLFDSLATFLFRLLLYLTRTGLHLIPLLVNGRKWISSRDTEERTKITSSVNAYRKKRIQCESCETEEEKEKKKKKELSIRGDQERERENIRGNWQSEANHPLFSLE